VYMSMADVSVNEYHQVPVCYGCYSLLVIVTVILCGLSEWTLITVCVVQDGTVEHICSKADSYLCEVNPLTTTGAIRVQL